jgi:hypothetical protein
MPTTTGNATQLITFSRGSLATVTDADGRIKWAPHNLLLASEQFDASSWVKTNVTVAANSIAAPNGTTTADKLIATNTSGVHRTYQTGFLGVSKAGVIYARAAEYNFISIGQTTGDYAVVNLTTGAVTQSSGTIPAPVSVGSGWWRIEIANTTVDYVLSVVDTGTFTADQYGSKTFTGDNTSGVYVWGAHLYRSDLGGMQANASAYPLYNPSTPKNIYGYSEAFDNAAWDKNVVTIPGAKVSAPNGSISAQTITANAGSGVIPRIGSTSPPSITDTKYTASIYAKAGTYSFVQIYINGQATEWANYTLSGAGTATANGACTASITAIADGWYRISITYTAASTGRYPLYMLAASATATRAQTWSPVGTESVSFWGAQLSDSASLDPYVGSYGAAPSAAAAHGPRLDYDPVTLAARGLLVEETRTNLATYSEDFTNWSSGGGGTTVNANGAIAPSGVQTADEIVASASNASRNRAATTTIVAQHTLSFWVRSGTATALRFGLNNGSWIAATTAVVSGSGSITGTDLMTMTGLTTGWTKVTLTTSSSVAAGTTTIYFYPGPSSQTAGDSVYVWGAQLEAGAFATSYIPTAASTVTRNADVASVATSQFPYSASEGTVVVSAASVLTGGAAGAAQYSMDDGNGGYDNYRVMYYNYVVGDLIVQENNNSNNFVANTTILNGASNTLFTGKAAYAYATGSAAASVNGAAATTLSTSGSPTPGLTRLGIGADYGPSSSGSVAGQQWIRQITYIPRRLTNAELQQRTSA